MEALACRVGTTVKTSLGAMESLVKDVVGLQKKVRVTGKKNAAVLSSLLASVRKCKTAAERGEGQQGMAALKKEAKEGKWLKKAKNEHRSLHVGVAKVGKGLTKLFPPPASAGRKPTVAERQAILAAICEHLQRAGAGKIATAIGQPAAFSSGQMARRVPTELVVAMETMLPAFRRGEYGPSIQWCTLYSKRLHAAGSTVEFELHKLRFVQLLKHESGRQAAVKYSQRHFPPFAAAHMHDIQRLMTAMLYAGQLASSPYASLQAPDLAARIENMLVADACIVHGLPPTGALESSVEAGFIILPSLAKLNTVMKATGKDMASMDDLPLESSLPDHLQFHSVLCCPVTREPVDAPVALSCGHVISDVALNRITASRNSFKCPTCRSDVLTRSTTRVKL